MIEVKDLKTVEDFENLKKGDIVIVEWKRDSYKNNSRTRFASYEIFLNKKESHEIILQKKNNVYFNYEMFLNPEIGISNIKYIKLIFKGQTENDKT
jgi:hypothetical protein